MGAVVSPWLSHWGSIALKTGSIAATVRYVASSDRCGRPRSLRYDSSTTPFGTEIVFGYTRVDFPVIDAPTIRRNPLFDTKAKRTCRTTPEVDR